MEVHHAILTLGDAEAHLIPHCLPCKNGALHAVRMFLSTSASCHVLRGLCTALTVPSTVLLTRAGVPGEMGSR